MREKFCLEWPACFENYSGYLDLIGMAQSNLLKSISNKLFFCIKFKVNPLVPDAH